MIRKAVQDLIRLLNRELLAQQRTERQQARELLRQAREAAREAERQRLAALGKATKADIVRWLKKDLVSDDEGRFRLEQLGYTVPDAERLIVESHEGDEGPPA